MRNKTKQGDFIHLFPLKPFPPVGLWEVMPGASSPPHLLVPRGVTGIRVSPARDSSDNVQLPGCLFIQLIAKSEFSGKNVTIPLKTTIFNALGGDDASPLASKASG